MTILHGLARMVCALLIATTTTAPAAAQGRTTPELTEIETLARRVFTNNSTEQNAVLDLIKARGNPDAAAALIQALRFFPDEDRAIVRTLEALTGATPGNAWPDWVLWQEENPQIEPFEGFDAFKGDVMTLIDPNFGIFLYRGVTHEIRLEEIVWGGVVKDGIPALNDPKHLTPDEAGYITEDELVFGVEINGDARAYPLRILNWHEMFNDVIGGVPVALAYCTLCGSGILFETEVDGQDQRFVFGSSGFLYRSNKLMYDQQTQSLWNQFTGRPVVGPLTGSGIELAVRPVVITTWTRWLARHPNTKVLSLDTGHTRDYRVGGAYETYFASPDLMFPALVRDTRLKPKDYVFALRLGDHEKAWALSEFEGGRVINDRIGTLDVVLIGDATSRTVRAYDSGGRQFSARDGTLASLAADGQSWTVGEESLISASGETLARLPGHIAYWFAWSGYKGKAPLYER